MKHAKGFKSISQSKATTETASGKPAATGNGSVPQGVTIRTVTIEAKVDVGFGNALYLRGEGHGLSWNRGIPLQNVDNSTWLWSGEASDKVKFKLLLNDAVWCQGEDLVAVPGQKVRVAPAF
jgi:hypothetical protein